MLKESQVSGSEVQPTQKSRMHFTVLSSSPAEPLGLAPTPNVADSDCINELRKEDLRPAITDLVSAGPIRILYSYRGWNLYCAGGVTVYRSGQPGKGGHGFAGEPETGDVEEVKISTEDGWHQCTIKFGAGRFTPDSIMGMLWKKEWEDKKLGSDYDVTQEAYCHFCRKHRIAPCWEPYGPYPVPPESSE